MIDLWPADGEGAQWGATHGTDLSPAFANPTTRMTGNTPGGIALARQIGSAFAAFAKTGNPGNPTMPAWDAYNPSRRAGFACSNAARTFARASSGSLNGENRCPR